MSNEAILGIVAAIIFFLFCVICCAYRCIDYIADRCAESSSDINENIEIVAEKKVPTRKLTLMHPDQLNPIL